MKCGLSEKPAPQEVRVALARAGAQHVENAPERVGAARQRRRELRLQQRPFRNMHVHQVVEAVVEHDLRVEDHDHVHAAEHLEHFFVQIEIDRR